MMKLQFTKNKDKPHVITYYRDNGSNTWMKADEYFVLHDLSHFAIEKNLDYKTAFYGMINRGMELEDFADRVKRNSMTLTNEAWYAESMANIFLMEIMQGETGQFNSIQQQAFREMGRDIDVLDLDDATIARVREYLKALIQQWKKMDDGDALQLEIDV
jgi:hypothetical protein